MVVATTHTAGMRAVATVPVRAPKDTHLYIRAEQQQVKQQADRETRRKTGAKDRRVTDLSGEIERATAVTPFGTDILRLSRVIELLWPTRRSQCFLQIRCICTRRRT